MVQTVENTETDSKVPGPPVQRSTEDSKDTQETPEYEINKIIWARYNKKGELEYLLDWKGWDILQQKECMNH